MKSFGMKEDGLAAQSFLDFVKLNSYKQPVDPPLTNLTFYLGAGFSMSWDNSYPSGLKLFEFPFGDSIRDESKIDPFLSSMNFDESRNLQYEDFKQLVYSAGMYKKYESIRGRYLDDRNIAVLIEKLRAMSAVKLMNSNLDYLDPTTNKFKISNPTTDKTEIIDFFYQLEQHITGGGPKASGIRTNFLTTNYDFIIETIHDSYIGQDDSAFLYMYRGITPTKIKGVTDEPIIHDNYLVSNLIKLNGGLEIFEDGSDFYFDYFPKTKKEIYKNPPQIMLPSKEQDYQYRYFKQIFPKAIKLLSESKCLVIVGYSLPEEDSLLRFVMKSFAFDNEDTEGKSVFYISPGDNKNKAKNLKEVFKESYDLLNINLFKGTFIDWCKSTTTHIKKLR